MTLPKDIARLLNLSPLELRVFEMLDKHGSLSMQELADTLKKPRTTVYWPLRQLVDRGLVDFDMVGKRKRWYAKTSPLSFLASSNGEGIEIVNGVEAMQKLYNIALRVGRNERVIILEGTKAVHSIKQKGGIEFMSRWHTRAHEKKIIIESILGKKTYDEVATQLVDASVIESLSRWETWIGYLVPDEWVATDSALVVFRQGAILADWSKEQALYIQAPELFLLLKNFCMLCQTFGKKVDIVQHVRKASAQKRH